jgi:hypothetical protein
MLPQNSLKRSTIGQCGPIVWQLRVGHSVVSEPQSIGSEQRKGVFAGHQNRVN